jgi:hypothetical protein
MMRLLYGIIPLPLERKITTNLVMRRASNRKGAEKIKGAH